MQKSTVLEKDDLRAFKIDLKVQMVTVWSSRFGKT